MSSIAKAKELIKRYSIARIPFIAVNSIEKARVLEMLKEISEELSLQFYVHSLSKGVYDLATEKTLDEDKSIYGAIDYMTEQMKRKQYLTMVLTEVPDLSSDNSDAKQLLALATLANESGGVIIVLTNNPVWNQLQRLGMTVKVDLPNEDEMYTIIKEYIDDYRQEIPIEWDNSDIREAASVLVGVTRIEVENTIAALIANKCIRKSDMNEIYYVKSRLFSEVSGLEKIDVEPGARDIGGMKGLRKWLNEKKELMTPENREKLRAKGLQPPRGILLVGVPGCGKSLSVKYIATYWKLPLYRLDFATIQGSYVGQSERQLRDALHIVEKMSPCILWIDEIEKGLSGAGSNDDGGVSTRMVGQFLFWMQESRKPVFVAATANDISKLPAELLRRGRFDELFFMDLPTASERREILSLYTKKYLNMDFTSPFSDKIVKMTRGFTGADLESVIRNLAYQMIFNEDFVVNEKTMIDKFRQVVPFFRTYHKQVQKIRRWGKDCTIPASGKPIRRIPINKFLWPW